MTGYCCWPLGCKVVVPRCLARSVSQMCGSWERPPSLLREGLQTCGYPQWVISRACRPRPAQRSTRATKSNNNKGAIVIPYIKGLTEQLTRIYNRYGIKVWVKPTHTLRQLLCAPKDKTKKEQITGPVYRIACGGDRETSYKEVYIGETERTLKARFQEHRRPSSITSEVSKHIHIESPGHTVTLDNITILDREPKWFERGIKEAIHIRVEGPSLNRDGCRYQLPHIWDTLLARHLGTTTLPPSGQQQ